MPNTFETGASNALTNDIVLTVINDGDGSQCGMDYNERCLAAAFGIAQYRTACRNYAPTASHKQIIEAATLIQEYYREQSKEVTE